MSGMYGADVEQLRALARSFDAAANKLDHDRMTVGNAIRINAWVGPVAVRFRAEWDSAHSAKVAGAARRLHAAAQSLRKNADDQERTSQANGANPGGGTKLPPGALNPAEMFRPLLAGIRMGALEPSPTLGSLLVSGVVGTVTAFSEGVHDTLDNMVKVVELPHAVAEYGNRVAVILASGKGAEAAGHLDEVMAASRFGGLLDVAGKTIGGVSVVLSAVDTLSKASAGDTGGAIISGIKTGLGIAAFAPPPVGPMAAAAGIGITVGEMLSKNPVVTKAVTDVVVGAGEAIGRGVGNAVQAINRIGEGVGKATGNFLEGLGQAAKKWLPW
ncbi:WXG100 family type VII secretion target [Microbacterium trichothecenolyticum]|uniref:Uncharacterized protein YukE n=1 Tax=Microbacterium trichothecenolyticum TaxID=69370 RepID=A0ABU0TYJ2_MICTR|nr:hypothetical protein [Microbacterium trichothecenolyticum]MDQ1124718.1 uncharacterized protein YukE [Microbacterium trichothecenolyticum]